ncbi:MAG: DUF6056 family protein [Brevinema sp.]
MGGLFLRNQLKHIVFFLLLIFLLALILPIFYLDDINYAVAGFGDVPINVFMQEVHEYLTWHGRFLTHLIARIILQNRWTADILTTIMAAFFLIMAWVMVYPNPKQKKLPYLLPIFWTALILFFSRGVWLPMVQVVHFASYRLSFALIALFLWPYLRFLHDSSYNPSYFWLAGWGIIAGSTHEQVVVLTPVLLMMAFILRLRKESIPLWYWIGCIAVVLGNFIVLGSPYGRSVERLITYGGVLQWDFFGQKLNWLELGWMRYFYSLAKILVAGVPLALPWFILFGVFLWKYLKISVWTDRKLLPPLFLLMLGQAFFLVMMFSPRVTSSAFVLGLDFTITACFSLIALYGEIKGWQEVTGKKWMPYLYMALLIPLLIQLPSSIAYRKYHWDFIKSLKNADLNGINQLAVKAPPIFYTKTPFGNIRFISPPNRLQSMALYHGYGHIKIEIIQ